MDFFARRAGRTCRGSSRRRWSSCCSAFVLSGAWLRSCPKRVCELRRWLLEPAKSSRCSGVLRIGGRLLPLCRAVRLDRPGLAPSRRHARRNGVVSHLHARERRGLDHVRPTPDRSHHSTGSVRDASHHFYHGRSSTNFLGVPEHDVDGRDSLPAERCASADGSLLDLGLHHDHPHHEGEPMNTRTILSTSRRAGGTMPARSCSGGSAPDRADLPLRFQQLAGRDQLLAGAGHLLSGVIAAAVPPTCSSTP